MDRTMTDTVQTASNCKWWFIFFRLTLSLVDGMTLRSQPSLTGESGYNQQMYSSLWHGGLR